MVKFMLALYAIAALIIASSLAHAQWNGNQIGNSTFWNNSSTGHSVTCSRIGNTTFCN